MLLFQIIFGIRWKEVKTTNCLKPEFRIVANFLVSNLSQYMFICLFFVLFSFVLVDLLVVCFFICYYASA